MYLTKFEIINLVSYSAQTSGTRLYALIAENINGLVPSLPAHGHVSARAWG